MEQNQEYLRTISYNTVVSPILCGTVEVQDWVSVFRAPNKKSHYAV